jgi:hypothetical protein
VIRFASVRYDGVLGPSERDETVRSLRSTGVDVTSWNVAAGRTYFRARLAAGAEPAALASRGAAVRVDVPPLAILRVRPLWPAALPGVRNALAGAGRPAGMVEVRPDGAGALVVEFDCRGTAPALVVALIDAELKAAPGRRIEPLLPLEDDVLAALAGALLAEPAIDGSRLIETYLEPLLQAGRA